MSHIISEGSELIGSINDNGYVFDPSGNCIGNIDDSGYIQKSGGFGILGKIDEDGTIHDSSIAVIGRIDADGYVYIHSKRVCRVNSDFIKRVTPHAWNAGHIGEYPNAPADAYEKPSYDPPRRWPFGFGTTVKLIIGVILGIACIISAASSGSLSFGLFLFAIPGCIAVVFIACFIIKLFN